jgi:hypothetical protein
LEKFTLNKLKFYHKWDILKIHRFCLEPEPQNESCLWATTVKQHFSEINPTTSLSGSKHPFIIYKSEFSKQRQLVMNKMLEQYLMSACSTIVLEYKISSKAIIELVN